MDEKDPLVERELDRVRELNLLEEGEILVESVVAVLEGAVGTIVVTDRRVLFVSTTLFRKRTKVISTPFDEIVDARASDVWAFGMKDRCTLTLEVASEGAPARKIEWRGIAGGITRGNEIAESILRERQRYARRQDRS